MEGRIAGVPWASLSISQLFPHIVASLLKFFQGGSGLKRCTEREREKERTRRELYSLYDLALEDT